MSKLAVLRAELLPRLRVALLAYTGAGGLLAVGLVAAVLFTPAGAAIQEAVAPARRAFEELLRVPLEPTPPAVVHAAPDFALPSRTLAEPSVQPAANEVVLALAPAPVPPPAAPTTTEVTAPQEQEDTAPSEPVSPSPAPSVPTRPPALLVAQPPPAVNVPRPAPPVAP